MSVRSIRRRSTATVALALSVPLIAGAGLMGAGIAHLPSAVGQGIAPAAADGDLGARLPTQLFPTGPQDYTDEQLSSGDLTVPTSELSEELAAWQVQPGTDSDVDCEGTVSVTDPGEYSTCTLTAEDGTETTYYGYVARYSGEGGLYELFFAKDAPLSDAGAAALNDDRNAVVVHPVYDETQADQPDVLSAADATTIANSILESTGGGSAAEVVSVESAVDLTTPEPVLGTARNTFTGEETAVRLLPVVLDGEAPALVVSIDSE